MEKDAAQVGVGALVIEQDQRHHNTAFGQGPDLVVHGLDISPLEAVGLSLAGEPGIVRVAPWIHQLGPIEIERGMTDAQGDRVVHHLHLKPLLGRRLRIRFRIGGSERIPAEAAERGDEDEHHRPTIRPTHVAGRRRLMSTLDLRPLAS